jgi:DNA invertase Pin-like site-specific DNA recombinase
MNDKKITALYCRLSREDERADFSSSIETQKKYLSRQAKLLGLIKVKYYIDDGYSGTSFDRPAFKQLLQDIENKLIENVLVKDLSRLGRNYLTTGYYIEHYFPINSVRFIAINDQVDTDAQQNDFMPFKNIMNEWYARDISRKIKSAYRTKALNGEWIGMVFKQWL